MTHRSSRSSSTEPFGIFRPSDGLEKRAALVAIEGPDGSGKTTLANGLAHRFRAEGQPVCVTGWNEATEIYNLMMRLNAAGSLDNHMRCVFGAVELAARYQYVVRPSLHRGEPVLVNKYVVSAVAHALVRGHDESFLEALYGFAAAPDVTVYVDVPPPVGLERKLAGGRIGFWEAGLDLSLGLPLEEALARYRRGEIPADFLTRSFVDFQARLRDLHRDLLGGNEVTVVDGEASPAALVEAAYGAVRGAVERAQQVLERDVVA
jgi:dTMP kinase